MRMVAAIRRLMACGLLAVGLSTPVFAAMPATAMAMANDRTGPPGSEKSLSGVGSKEEVEIGRRIYLEGIGANGKPIVGLRFGGVEMEGPAVVCVTCHRRSGLGAVEGVDQVAPIAGRFTYGDDPLALVSMNFRNIKNFNQKHEPFDDQSFAAAIRQGKHMSGRDLSPIMPRFEFSEAELRGLSSYLRTLSAKWSPGVDARVIQFATVITPDVSPQRKQVFLETIKAAVNQKNGNFAPRMRTMSTSAEMMLNTNRFWNLSVWELTGEPNTWAAQLEERYRAQPVFALVSGLGAGHWEPVHEFCERQRVACWFPSVDAPPVSHSKDFYSMYFSGGVELEAEVLARQLSTVKPTRLVQMQRGDAVGRAGAAHLQAALASLAKPIPVVTRTVDGTDAASLSKDFYSMYFSGGAELEADVLARHLSTVKPTRLVQLQRGDAVGRAGAAHLQAALASLAKPIPVVTRTVDGTDAASLSKALADVGTNDAVMLWWPQADVPALGVIAMPKGSVYLSARMAGAEHAALPTDWKSSVRMVYPYQLPEKRAAGLFYFNSWLKVVKIELREEALQSEVYFAMSYLTETLTDMLDNLHVDYLIERAENMLSLREGTKAEDEARELTTARYNKGGVGGAQGAMARLALPEARKSPRPMPGQTAQVMHKREGTTVYPRLSLAQGQRFASKGAYIVHFAADGKGVVADSDWIVP